MVVGDKTRVSYGGRIRAGFHTVGGDKTMQGFIWWENKSRVSYGGGDKLKKVLHYTLL